MKKPASICAILILLLFSAIFGSDYVWPVKRDIDLASGFGDYRAGRFHAGLDIRTGGQIGEPVYSPVDGHVWRIRTHYSGYGKVLYIRGEDEHIYVFAHLNKFIPEIQAVVEETQVASQRYYTDIYLPDDSIKIKRGQLIAQSGETGAGPPHLHFERRSPDNRPINPLTHGFHLDDQIRPVFTRIGFQVTDDSSLFDVGLRKVFYNVKHGSGTGEYYLDTVLYFNCPFGVLADCYDLMRSSGMRRSVRKLNLYVDDVLYYESILDTLDYGTEQSSFFEYDYVEAVEDHSKVRRLYSEYGNNYAGSKAKNGFKGYFGESLMEKLGRRKGKIVAEDCCGNQSTLTFDFYWGPADDIFKVDSTSTPEDDVKIFYFSPATDYNAFNIDSITAFYNYGENWSPSKSCSTEFLDDGKIVCTVRNKTIRPLVLRLFIFAEGGCLIRDNLFNGIIEALPKTARSSEISVDEEGLWVTVNSNNIAASRSWVKLYHGDTLLTAREAKFFNMANYRCFIRAREEFATVDKIGMVFGDDPNGREYTIDTLRFNAVGFGKQEVLSSDGRFSLSFNEKTLYRPMFIQIIHHPISNKVRMYLNSDHYEILPEVFRCREEFDISYQMGGELPKNEFTGLCWLDKKNDEWVWLENSKEGNVVTAKSIGGGSFACVIDYEPPLIANLNIRANRHYTDSTLPIKFLLRDTLSGFEDDQSITIKLDGEWIIPEYDPESDICTSKALRPLQRGEHHLEIVAVDRAGQKTEKYLKFIISKATQRR